MLNLKSIYFYFLALQISLIKFVKKIYFSTNYYNKSLISETPQQFYFHPNPFLLSTITSYKKYSFKISKIDPNIFWINQKNLKELGELHNFLWLNLIDRKNDGRSLQKIINLWMFKHSKYKKHIWESSILSKRVISWILNADIILNKERFEFKKNFLTSIIQQANHLKKNIKFEKNYSNRIEVLTALVLTGLVFKEYEDNYNIAIKELEKLVKNFFDQVFALIAMMVLSPLLLGICVFVYIFISQEILFTQLRPGLKGKKFKLYKFRSMMDYRDAAGNLLPDEQRLNRAGKWLRSSSLDELPELLNILKGEMSFVGPRPLLNEYLPLYTPEQKKRHDVKPGLTGLAQVNGRNKLEWEEKFILDIKYVEDLSIVNDIKILLKTAIIIFRFREVNSSDKITMSKFSGTRQDSKV